MASSAPELVYATVAYWQPRELPLLQTCVESLLNQERVAVRILLVSNGCDERPHLPADERIEHIQLAQNRGFAGGHNAGIRRALENGASHVLLFNSDAIADPGCLHQLLSVARSHPRAAFVGPLIVRARQPNVIECAGQRFNPRTGRHTELLRGQPADSVDGCPRQVDALSGCALLATRAAVESIGLLDEQLFAYFEDMDWCLRARRAGYDVVVAPGARVRHLGEGSTGGASPLASYYSVRNHMLVASKYGGAWTAPLVLAYHAAYLARSPERRTKENLIALVRGAWAAVAHRH